MPRPNDFLRPPDDLPTDPERFFRGPPPLPVEHVAVDPNPLSALDRLGSSPLPKTGFPFVGFLSGVYEHLSQVAKGETPPSE